MPLSWNEIKSRALAFIQEWENETSEEAVIAIYEFVGAHQPLDKKRERINPHKIEHVRRIN